MKSILLTIYGFLESMGKARAAAELARAGKHKEAAALYRDEKFEVHP
jgi:hypothetical protein